MIRVQYEKIGDIAYISHLDIVKLMERISRRANIKLLYSQGFSPHPKTSFSPALSVGTWSLCEYLDLELEDEDIELEELLRRYNLASVEGITFTQAKKMPCDTPAIVSFVTHSRYEFYVEESVNTSSIQDTIDFIKNTDSILLTRTSKRGNAVPYELKELIHAISFEEKEKMIDCTISSSSSKILNPKNFLSYILEKSHLPKDTFVRIQKIDTFHMDELGKIQRPL